MNLSVSIIIPAFNAAATIAETIDSLLVQSFKDWEAIIVDDGSTDQTVNILKKYIDTDSRIRLVSQSNKGLAGARNTGIQLARFNWILFLDGDDWISDNYLKCMTDALAENPEWDAVHCGWSTVAPDGTIMDQRFAAADLDMFPSFVRTCAFVIHSCVISKSLVISSGGFDPAFVVCADWDFWQRISRMGARFGTIREVYAYYRMRPDSLSKNVKQSLFNSLKIIEQGHLFDARVNMPVAKYIDGINNENINYEKLFCITWFAGLSIGKGEEAWPLLQLLNKECTANLEPGIVSAYIFEAICFYNCMPPGEGLNLWRLHNKNIKKFLLQLELHSQTNGLLSRTLIALERLILQHAKLNNPLIFETSYALNVELTEPMPDINPPATMERMIVKVKMEGNDLGVIEFPITDPVIPGWKIKDRIASQFSWPVLKRYFEYTVYAETLKAASNKSDFESMIERLHNEIGWKEFLRALWNKKDWEVDNFYDPEFINNNLEEIPVESSLPEIEVSECIPDITLSTGGFVAMIKIGGASFGCLYLPVKNSIIKAQTILAAITNACGYDLCIVCVREALIGQPLKERTSLQDRLKNIARNRKVINNEFGEGDVPMLLWATKNNYEDVDIKIIK